MQTATLKEAMHLIEADGLSAAILDHGLHDGNSNELCERLADWGIPVRHLQRLQPRARGVHQRWREPGATFELRRR